MHEATNRAAHRLTAMIVRLTSMITPPPASSTRPDNTVLVPDRRSLPYTARAELDRAGRAALTQAWQCYRDGGRCTDDEAAWLTLLLRDRAIRDHAGERIDRGRCMCGSGLT
jgi:hypothetical protein